MLFPRVDWFSVPGLIASLRIASARAAPDLIGAAHCSESKDHAISFDITEPFSVI